MNLYQMSILIVLLFPLSDGAVSPSTSIKSLSRQAKQLSSRCVCGIENTNTKLQRIIAGTEIKPELRFPWLVPLAYRNGSFFCGGTLINSRYILTSAHCFRYSKQDAAGELRYMISSDAIIVPERYTANMLVGLGVHNLIGDNHQPPTNSYDEKDKIQPIWQTIDYAIVHRFYENFETAIRHDIALIRLRKEIDFDRFKWLRPICLPDEDQFEMDRFNKFQLQQYIQPNAADSVNSALPIATRTDNQVNSQANSQTSVHKNNQMNNQVNSQVNNHNANRISINQMKNQLNNQLVSNGPGMLSSMFNMNDNVDFHSYLVMNNETIKLMDRINSKRLSFEKMAETDGVTTNRTRRDLGRDEDQNDELFFSAGWGSTERRLDNGWKLSKVPLWMQLRMLTREQCIEKNGERVKWNFVCAEGIIKEQETAVGDSGGPLFGQIKRKHSNMKNRIMTNRPVHLSSTTRSNSMPTFKATTSTNLLKQTALKFTSTKRTTTTQRPITTQIITTTAIPATTSVTERLVIKYITKAPLAYKLLSKRPQKQQQQISNDMNNLLTKVKENTNRHFYSAMIYEDLFKTLNLPHDDLAKVLKDELKEGKDVIEGDDLEVENDNSDVIRTASTIGPVERINSTKLSNLSTSTFNHELDLSTSNYVQLGITSWSSYLNPAIGMYTDIRAYMSWIKKNTQDAQYCITNPSKLTDDTIPLPSEKPDLPDLNSNLNCGAERLAKVSYPWINSLYIDDKFLGNCIYFYSNFVICSDIYAEQITQEINSLVHRFSVQFYYPNYRFRARNIVNKLLGSSTVNRREYMIVQLEDPDNRLPRDPSGRKLNRAIIDAQINKMYNAQASCISTRDYPMNEESSSLVTFYLFAPGENLVKTQLKLTTRRKCRQLAPNFVTSRFLCAQIGASEEINISEQMVSDLKPALPNRFEPNYGLNATTMSFTMKLKNFFRIQTNRFHGHYSNLNQMFKNDYDDFSDGELMSDEKQNKTLIDKKSRGLLDRSNDNIKEILDGQPVFHKIDEQYTLVGFLVKAPFPLTTAFRRNNLILLLDLKKFRFQLVTKLIKSLRAYNRA